MIEVRGLRGETGGASPIVTFNAMSQALRRISRSPFFEDIKRIEVPRYFTRPAFVIYNGKTDPVEHLSHFSQLMALYHKKDSLMCKVFLSSLSPIAIRWFNGKSNTGI